MAELHRIGPKSLESRIPGNSRPLEFQLGEGISFPENGFSYARDEKEKEGSISESLSEERNGPALLVAFVIIFSKVKSRGRGSRDHCSSLITSARVFQVSI